MIIADEKKEPKDRAVQSVSVPFQGRNFHPCFGWTYSLRWGEYIFDIRSIREYFGVKETQAIDIKPDTQANFCKKMMAMISLVGEHDFIDLNRKIQEQL